MHRRRSAPGERDGEDEFRRWFRCIVEEPAVAGRLREPAVRAAFVSGQVPTWTSTGEELYAVVTTRRVLGPRLARRLTGQTLALTRMLGIPSVPGDR
ncbi:hypothetical protein [Actinoplanes regularis]|uniref:hypothetical protein n=1 Tax=Actinoplanes regularis TaxID=52697 RepID=UPI0024A3E6E1|nr:hypothetical protein [Actinoplanes regularis]GLW30344.1 hypothetical protein Areg01_32840 [Actinoplanes regularis]